MAKHISCDTAILLDPNLAPADIDRCLQSMLDERRPCYIGVPVDMSHLTCDDAPSKQKLRQHALPNNAEVEIAVVKMLRDELGRAKSPVIVVDGNATRGDAKRAANDFCHLTGLPTFVTMMGKGAFDESLPSFGGLYAGSGSAEGVISTLGGSDTIFWLGPYPVSMIN